MSKSLKIYIGYDDREQAAWQVCEFSIRRHATCPVEIYPLRQCSLRELGLYSRPKDQASTEFSLTRFLTPYLAGHTGLSLFVDCDFLFTGDVSEIVANVDPTKAVHVIKHDYVPANSTKMDGVPQVKYPRKNWSSFMLFNNSHPCCIAMTPEVVNSDTPAFLHRFRWVSDDNLIGQLSLSWNFLVGEYSVPVELPRAIHFTNGGPWFEECRHVDFAGLWLEEQRLFRSQETQTRLG